MIDDDSVVPSASASASATASNQTSHNTIDTIPIEFYTTNKDNLAPAARIIGASFYQKTPLRIIF
jgi:hypothetical protein